jgi:TetR/AcrR family transcriptional repressor of uid operon
VAEPAAVLALALDPAVETPDDSASERILDAALETAAAYGVRGLTMDEVARRAGLGRMTVYRRFGTKTELLDALAVRECRRCLAEIGAAVDLDAPAVDQVVDGFAAAIGVARGHPLLVRLSRLERESLLATLGSGDGELIMMMRAFLRPLIVRARRRGQIRRVNPDQAAELLVRIGLSVLLLPESVVALDDRRATRRFARELLAPLVVEQPSQ